MLFYKTLTTFQALKFYLHVSHTHTFYFLTQKYIVVPPFTVGGMFQDPQWLPETKMVPNPKKKEQF